MVPNLKWVTMGAASDAKSSALYSNAESNLGTEFLGEVEKDHFIGLPGKERHLKSCVLPCGR